MRLVTARRPAHVWLMATTGSRRWRRRLARVLLWSGLLYMLLRWFEYHQVFQPLGRLDADASALGGAWEEVRFQTGDGVNLHAWFLPAPMNSARAGLAVLFSHGNAGNISHRLDACGLLLELGVNGF